MPVSEAISATPLELAAVTGSRTERVCLAELHVPDEYVLTVQPLAEYRTAGRLRMNDARPHVFALARRVLDELAAERAAAGVVESWTPRFAALRERAYSLADAALAANDARYRREERLRLVVAASEAVGVLSRALLVARSGSGLTADNTAQLHARSALFILIQGQTAQSQAAELADAAGREVQ